MWRAACAAARNLVLRLFSEHAWRETRNLSRSRRFCTGRFWVRNRKLKAGRDLRLRFRHLFLAGGAKHSSFAPPGFQNPLDMCRGTRAGECKTRTLLRFKQRFAMSGEGLSGVRSRTHDGDVIRSLLIRDVKERAQC